MLDKAANFIKRCKPSETAIVYHGGCGDGLCAAAILLKTFQKLFGETPKKVYFASAGKVSHVKVHAPKIIFVDLAADTEKDFLLELKKKSKILVIDHHQLTNDLNKLGILHVHPGFVSDLSGTHYCGAKLTYDVCSRATDTSDLDWLAAIGIIHDVNTEAWQDFIDGVFAKYKELGKTTYSYEGQMGKLIGLITAAQDLRNGNELVLKIFLEAERPADILEEKFPEVSELAEINKAREEELNQYVAEWEKLAEYDKKLKLVFYDVELKHKISSVLSTVLSLKYPDLLFIVMNKESPTVLKLNFRQHGAKVDCAWLAKASTEPFGGSGGGHKPASGGRVPLKFKEQFKEKVRELLKKA